MDGETLRPLRKPPDTCEDYNMMKPTHWSSTVLNEVLCHDAQEIHASVLTCRLHQLLMQPEHNKRTVMCHCSGNNSNNTPHLQIPHMPATQMTTIVKPLIEEESHHNQHTILQLEQKLSDASCHKQAQGLLFDIST